MGDTSERGGERSSPKWNDGLRSAFTITIRNTEILLCGVISSLFEGSMYIFVFMWTPALTEGISEDEDLPFGLIFSTFMVCCMAGSSCFSILIDRVSGEVMAIGLFAVAATAMGMIAICHDNTLKFLAMNLFEITVGMYWPIMGTMKGAIVPESKRAAIYNLFRIPLNFIVLFSLLTDLTPFQSFLLNAFMLSIATALQFMLMVKRREVVNAIDSQQEGVSLVEKDGQV
jgi:MFS family permease